jgi:RimJ/RimL family protein N-acetyltransferase
MHPKSIDAFQTARLRAERLASKHLTELTAMHSDSRMMATLGGVRSVEQNREYLAAGLAHWAQYGFGLWIWYNREGRTVGRGGIRHATIDGADKIEIAYSIIPEFWGRGFATEIALEAVKIAATLQIRELAAFTLEGNAASLRVMKKVGFRLEKRFIHHRSPCLLYRLAPVRPASPPPP